MLYRIDAIAGVVLAALLAAALPAAAQTGRITARQVIERIQQHVGVPWHEPTVDTFKAGDPDTQVTGIAVAMMSTYAVLQRAAEAGCNLVITHEPTFYGHFDSTADLEQENDPVYAEKAAFIKQHRMVIWRFHDHWHMRRPDGIQEGMIHALGWDRYKNPQDDYVFTLPPMSVEALASSIKRKLRIRTLRVVGDPHLVVTKVGLAPGAPGFAPHRHMLQRPDVEALVIGEGTEWESIEYGADAAAQKRHKALIILGHIPSEQAGMENCAEWLRTFVKEAPITYVATPEPFWSPP